MENCTCNWSKIGIPSLRLCVILHTREIWLGTRCQHWKCNACFLRLVCPIYSVVPMEEGGPISRTTMPLSIRNRETNCFTNTELQALPCTIEGREEGLYSFETCLTHQCLLALVKRGDESSDQRWGSRPDHNCCTVTITADDAGAPSITTTNFTQDILLLRMLPQPRA